jgi:type 1 glutamine amidotransferase
MAGARDFAIGFGRETPTFRGLSGPCVVRREAVHQIRKRESMKNLSVLLVSAAIAASGFTSSAAPLKVLLLTGGCCHDYAKQKDILKKGLEERLNIEITQIHTDDKSTHPPLPIYGNPDYAKGYDLVIHDECSADIKDTSVIQGVLKPHKDGVPAVNLHCAMHCYRFGDFKAPVAAGADNAAWYDYLGLQTTGHGAQEPISIHFVDLASPVTAGLSDWTTIKEELYNNISVHDSAHPLAKGTQITKNKDGSEKKNETVVAWYNFYGDKKTRVYSTTIGHNNETVADARYLDMVANGVVWALNREDVRKK